MAQRESISILQSCLWIVAIAAFALLPAILFGPPLGHSLANNLVWLSSFDAGIWRGEIYPRWMPELWFGAGAPDFFFYGPLPFWLTSVFGRGLCWTCDVPGLLNAGTFVILALSGFGYFLFARRFLDRDRALIAAGIYMILPYHLMIDWGVRQALGELGAVSVLPFIVYFLIGLLRGNRLNGVGLALSIAALVLCHLPSVVIAVMLFGPIVLFYGFRNTQSLLHATKTIGLVAFWASVGIAISAFYWLPALGLLSDVSSQTLWQTAFNWSHWLFYDGQPEPNEALTMLLKIWLVGLSIFTALAFRRLLKNKEVIVWVLAPLLIAWVFLTPLSWVLWRYLPFLQAIQFPWRFMMIAEFGLPLAIGFVLPQGKKNLVMAGLTLVMFSGLNGIGGYQLGNILGVPRSIVEGNVADHLSALEYLPKTAFDSVLKQTDGKRDALRADWRSNPSQLPIIGVVSGDAKAEAVMINSRHWVVTVDAAAPSQIVFRQFYWKLWSAHDLATASLVKMTPEAKFGLIAFEVPSGFSKISIELDWHWTEKFGFAISLLSLVFIGFAVWFWKKQI